MAERDQEIKKVVESYKFNNVGELSKDDFIKMMTEIIDVSRCNLSETIFKQVFEKIENEKRIKASKLS